MQSRQRIWGEKPYHSLDYALKNIYGEKIYKIALDAGMPCPNRDGTKGTRGCIFCSQGGSGEFAAKGTSITQQLAQGKEKFRGKKIGCRYIAYFQAFTNTYAPVERLEALYRCALSESSVVGISIATRPDCLDDSIIHLLDRLKQAYPDKFIWIELGLQTISDATARFIRRGYPLSVFEEAVQTLQDLSIPVIAHVILGLPKEDKSTMIATCRYLDKLHIDGIKLQLLHVLKHTDLADLYQNGAFEVLDFSAYIDIVISCLEVLSPDIVIHRVTGDGAHSQLIAPLWSLDKKRVLNTLHHEMKRRGTFQSAAWEV